MQVLIDATSRPEFAVLDLAAGQSGGASRPAVIADMPLDSARQHVYAVSSARVSKASKLLYQLTLQSGVIVTVRGLSYHTFAMPYFRHMGEAKHKFEE